MKQCDKNIYVGIGVWKIKYGQTRNEVENILGKPDESKQYSYSPDEYSPIDTDCWTYLNFNIKLNFDQEDNWRLVCITINSSEYTLYDNIHLGINQNTLKKTLTLHDVKDLKREDFSTIENPTHELLSSDSLQINFWFDNNQLTEMQCSPLWIDSENIKWPK